MKDHYDGTVRNSRTQQGRAPLQYFLAYLTLLNVWEIQSHQYLTPFLLVILKLH
jgi:hypothetical protein